MLAACFHVLAHAVTKSMLFLCCGTFIEEAGGKEQLENLKGAAYRNPLAGIAFIVAFVCRVHLQAVLCGGCIGNDGDTFGSGSCGTGYFHDSECDVFPALCYCNLVSP
mgnify:CR=1 FL=1